LQFDRELRFAAQLVSDFSLIDAIEAGNYEKYYRLWEGNGS
jgi:hypothetical protein